MSTSRAQRPWSEVAVRHLLDSTSCPVCEVGALFDRHCRNCGTELTDQLATELWAASQAASEALLARQKVLDRVAHPSSAIKKAAPARVRPAEAPAPAVARVEVANQRSSASVQSVLAVAGAGLFAVAAIVFTFFNPDLTDRVARSSIVGIVTILFLGGAWLLARRRLQFSAEAVGGLGMVFVALDVYAFSEMTPTGASPWVFAAVGTLVSGAAMVAVSARARIRSWLWISLLSLAAVPAMLGHAGATTLSATLGHLGVGFAGLALMAVTVHLAPRFTSTLHPERMSLAAAQIIATSIVAAQLWSIEFHSTTQYWLTVTAVLAAVTVLAVSATRHLARPFWSLVAGAAGVGAIVSFPFALDLGAQGGYLWYLTIPAVAGGVGLLAVNTLAPRVRTLNRHASLGGAFTIAGVSVLFPVLLALMIGAVTVLGALSGSASTTGGVLPAEGGFAVVLGLAAMAAGLAAFSVITGRNDGASAGSEPASPRLSAATGAIATWLLALAGLTLACLPSLPLWARIALALGLAAGASLALVAVPRIRTAALKIRLPLVTGIHLAMLLAIICSAAVDAVTVGAGIAIVATIAVVARAMPVPLRFLYVGGGYAYALFVFATALDQAGVGTIALLSLTTSFASIVAVCATLLQRVPAAAWHAMLAVTSVPFLIGVVQVIFERSGWTALSTGLIFLLALTLLGTRRAGLGVGLRAIAAGLLVPSLAVVVVCLGAQVLPGSASPVALPVIATIVAVVLPSTGLVGATLVRRRIRQQDATAARIAIETSALLTGGIAVMLALVRVAAGLPTTFMVLIILGIGAAATSFWGKRRYGWWVAFAAFTGALWCLWGVAGIGVLEPYLLPPSLGAAAIAVVLTARGRPAVPLYATGLVTAVVPVLVLLAATGTGAGALASWRGYGLIAASWLLLGLGALLDRSLRLRVLRAPTLWVAIATAAAGAVQAVRFGLGADVVATGETPLILLCFGIALAGALPAAIAARTIRITAPVEHRVARNRWLYAPAATYIAVGTWTAIDREWFSIWAMWSLMLAYLVAVVVIAWRLRSRPTSMPPVWFVFGLAFATAIVAWSPRELRVEAFSIPLGLFLLAAGAVIASAQGGDSSERGGTLNSWPSRWTGSWALLAPGLVTLLLASVISTFTDPLTWRAILVMGIALASILVGSTLKLAAPFVIGIVVLPIENVFVFLVQIGRGIESMPWWITLAVVGAVLLIIAVTYERRAGEENSITARMRDLG